MTTTKMMTKADFITAIAEESGLSKADADRVFRAIETVTQNKVAEGYTVPVAGVGKVAPVDKPERTMRNPATGESFVKPAHKAPKVTIGKALKEAADLF